MTTRVLEQNEIAINGVKYRTVGGVTLSVASVWPEKQVTGDYNEDTDPNRSIHTWNDQRGGIGVDRWKGPEDDDRAWYSECWLRNRNHLVLPPRSSNTATDGTASQMEAIGELNGSIYGIFDGLSIKKYTVDSWGTSLASPAATPELIGNEVVSGELIGSSAYIVFGNSTGYDYSTDGATWAASTKNAYQVVVWDGRLWGMDTAGQLWYTFTPGSGEINDAIVPIVGSTDVVLFVGPDAGSEPILYAFTGLGLFAHDAANSRFIKTGVPALHRDFTYHVSAVTWNGKIYIGSEKDVLEYDPRTGNVRLMGPGSQDGIPTAYVGYCTGLAVVPDGLILGTRAVSPGTTSAMYHWDGQGWQVLYTGTPLFGVESPMFTNSVGGQGRIWWIRHTAGRMEYVQYVGLSASPKTNTSWPYAASAIHKYPWFDAGQNEVTKTLLEVRVTCQDVTANETVKVEIAYDYAEGASDASYTTLGTIAAAGNNTTTTYSINSGVGTDFQALRIKLTLSRGGTNTLSPDVSRVSVVFRKKLLAKYKIEAKLDLTGEVEGRSPAEQRAALVTAVERTTLTEFTIRSDTGGTRNYQGDIYFSGMEKTGMDEGGIVDVVCIEI